MDIAQLQEKKDKFKYCLGGLQEGLRYGLPLMDHSNDIIGLIKQSMNKWKTNLYADGKLLRSVPIRRRIFQSDLFSSLLFVIAFLTIDSYIWENRNGKINRNGVLTRKQWSKS